MTRTFSTVLVANRGEIACRVIETLTAMGIRSVAVFSDADRNARHVAMADVAVRIGPAAPQASYLNIDAIVAAAKESGAEAVHPGYGFLSENAAFAQVCEDAGLVFIGPGVNALNIMGDKIRSKNHVSEHSVPVIPGVAKPGLGNDELLKASVGVGYPLLIKPSAGGGGKGMQVVEEPADLQAALVTARRVASSAFGDDTLFLERLIARPRHIEVQVLADNHGNVIHLGERECSLQRRHQKVIEEAPSPLLDARTRARIGQAACQTAASVGYSGAGTVEFLVSADAPDEFFFMEMNTRLQVEHPVTEMITGYDLVQWQVRIAAGERLTVTQDDVVLTGHAVEARVYAENPERGFLPTSGTVLALSEPSGDGVRVDSSLVPGLEIGSHYDPMLSKVIAWGETRHEALTRLDAALARTTILGLNTNIEYLRSLLADPGVQAGDLDTGLIERRMPQLVFRQADAPLLAAAALYLHAERWSSGAERSGAKSSVPERSGAKSSVPEEARQGRLEGRGPWYQPSGWRIGVARPSRYSLAVSATESVDVLVSGSPDRATVTVGDEPARSGSIMRLRSDAGQSVLRFSVEYDGYAHVLAIARDGANVWLGEQGFSSELKLRSRSVQLSDALAGMDRIAGAADPDVRSPMPGTVVTVGVTNEDTVEVGQVLLTVEAMKMEHKLLATIAGTVRVTVKPGDLVKLDQVVASVNSNHSVSGNQSVSSNQ